MDLPYLFNDHLRRGLAPEGDRIPVNATFMEYAHNAKSMDVGAVFPEKVTAPTSETLAHPFPAFFRGERGDLILGSNFVRRRLGRTGSFTTITLYDPATPASSVAVSSLGSWQHVSFERLWFASNLNQLAYSIPSNSSDKVYLAPRNVRALGKHGNRLLLGGVSATSGGSDWFQGSRWAHCMSLWRQFQPKGSLGHEDMTWDLSWIVYLEPGGGADDIPYHIGMAMLGVYGDAAFDYWLPFIDTYIENGEIGFIASKVNSAIFAIRELGRGTESDPTRVMVYGRDGISELKPRGNRYEEEVVSQVGIVGRGAVGGSLDAHVAVDSQYQVVVIPKAGEPQRFNHAGKLTPGESSGEYIVSFDELFNDYWITEGTQAWVYNGAFTGPIDICPTGLVRDSAAGLLGFAADQAEDDYPWEIRFVSTDLGNRDFKRAVTAMFEAVGLTDIEMKVDSRFEGDGDWFLGYWVPAYTKNYARSGRSGVELRISFRGTTTLTNPARLSSMEARYTGAAKNVRHGPAPRGSG